MSHADCPSSLPTAPVGATVSWNSSLSVSLSVSLSPGTVLTFTCRNGDTLYSKVRQGYEVISKTAISIYIYYIIIHIILTVR